jgi:hypothetical protein
MHSTLPHVFLGISNTDLIIFMFSSSVAIERMIAVMSGRYRSRRHELFLDKREREQCNGSRTSNLYQLSNPGFLGGGGEKDSAVIHQLIHIFKVMVFLCVVTFSMARCLSHVSVCSTRNGTWYRYRYCVH